MNPNLNLFYPFFSLNLIMLKGLALLIAVVVITVAVNDVSTMSTYCNDEWLTCDFGCKASRAACGLNIICYAKETQCSDNCKEKYRVCSQVQVG